MSNKNLLELNTTFIREENSTLNSKTYKMKIHRIFHDFYVKCGSVRPTTVHIC